MAEGISIFFFLPCSNLQGKWSGEFGQTNAGGGARNGIKYYNINIYQHYNNINILFLLTLRSLFAILTLG